MKKIANILVYPAIWYNNLIVVPVMWKLFGPGWPRRKPIVRKIVSFPGNVAIKFASEEAYEKAVRSVEWKYKSKK